MKNFDLDVLGVHEMNTQELGEANGGGLKEWLISKGIDLAVRLWEIAGEAYIDFSVETGGKYVIHHAY
jgi:hypothetical protein